MDRAERLADFLAGELGPVEHAELAAELERDPGLRTQLSAIRAADEALGGLSSPTAPEGFEARLDAAIAAELSTALAASPEDGERAVDELATRRESRGRAVPRWVTAASGVAAAVIVLAGAGVLASGVLGGGDDEGAFDADSFETADDSSAESAQTEPAEPQGPLLLAGDRDVDQAAVEALLDDPEIFGLTDRGLAAEAVESLAGPYARAFDGPAPDGRSADDFDVTDEAEEDSGEAASDGQADADDSGGAETLEAPTARDDGAEPAPLRIRGELSVDDRVQVGTCLTAVLDAQPGIVPVYAELATFGGDPVILYGLVTQDPDTGAFTRREVWAVDRSTCDIRLFVQN